MYRPPLLAPPRPLTGCPCGCSTPDECVTRQPIPTPKPSPCDYRCRLDTSWQGLERISREYGICPCHLERNPE